ncbi:MAG TPA: thioredoxin family protein [Planctomycetota bacterium]|nr:thioredoxin family protein [Planctomycetota bacterium]
MSPFEHDSTFDDLRRFSEGALSGDERLRFEARMRGDPELARMAAQFQEVWSATEVGLVSTATSRTAFKDLAPRLAPASDRSPWLRRAAAAAIFFLLATTAWLVWRQMHERADAVVELRQIPWSEAPAILPPEVALPAVLASWSPVRDGEIQWLESLEEARAVSAAVSRPIFVFGYIAQCPICQGFQRNEFQDPAIVALVDQAVPLRIDLLQLEPEELEAISTRRYPLLEMQDDRGKILHTFSGMFAEVDMQAELARAVAQIARPDWKIVNAAAAAFVRARAAEAGGRYGEASGSFAALAQNRELPKFAEAGSAALTRIGAAAANLLAEARASDPLEAPSARAVFDAGVERFSGTPYEAELRAVARAWSANGRVPVLAPK